MSEEDIAKITNLITDKKYQLLKYISLLASTLFGILISLQSTHTNIQYYPHLCFALAVCLLGLGFLLTCIALYAHVKLLKTLRQAIHDEYINARKQHREERAVSAEVDKIFLICEKIAYIFFALAICLLCIYSFLV